MTILRFRKEQPRRKLLTTKAHLVSFVDHFQPRPRGPAARHRTTGRQSGDSYSVVIGFVAIQWGSAWFSHIQWVDLRENLQEPIDFPMKYVILLYFSLKPMN